MARAVDADGGGSGGRQEALSLPPRRTVWAPATAPGRAAVGIMRVSGPDAAEACRRLTGEGPPVPRRATLRHLMDVEGSAIDRGLVLWFPAPGSATGEDLLELHHHGGSAVARALAEAIATVPGVRLAAPGEMTKRAFLAGKLDLTQAEAVADLVDASTAAQARQALRQMDGALGQQCAGWRERLLHLLALIEAEIDFAPDQDVPGDLHLGVRAALQDVSGEIDAALAQAGRGELLRVGVTVAVTGAPNVGKSSLVNLLARRDVALVTPIAGTTRDVIEVPLDLSGLPITLLDTAGLRETDDPVEAAGIDRARARAAQADLRLLLLDARDRVPEELEPRTIVVRTKADLAVDAPTDAISSVNGIGIDGLLARLRDAAGALAGDGDAALITAARHREALVTARAALERADAAHLEAALLAEDLRQAVRAIGGITGVIGVEDVLDRIFASFCIGK